MPLRETTKKSKGIGGLVGRPDARVNPVPWTYVCGFWVRPLGEIQIIHSRTPVRSVLWYGVEVPGITHFSDNPLMRPVVYSHWAGIVNFLGPTASAGRGEVYRRGLKGIRGGRGRNGLQLQFAAFPRRIELQYVL